MIRDQSSVFLVNENITSPLDFFPHISQLIEGKCLNGHKAVFHYPGLFIYSLIIFVYSFYSFMHLFNRHILSVYLASANMPWDKHTKMNEV